METFWEYFWPAFGLVGQAIFGGAFVLQWLASERRKRSHVPVSFWYLRIVGSVMLLAFSLNLMFQDIESLLKAIVLPLGFSLNTIIYVRNLMLIYRRRAQLAGAVTREAPEEED